jgi:hypothetical protein
MTNNKVFSAIVVLVLVLALAGIAGAQGIQSLPGSGWWTSVGIQNTGSATANVVLTAYHSNDSSSTDTHTASFTITAGSSVTFLPVATGAAGTVATTPALESGFAGSAVVSSDQPLVAIGQVGNNQQFNNQVGVAGGTAKEMYRGSTQGATSLSYPTVKYNFAGHSSTFYLQAAGTDVIVNATVKDNAGGTHTASKAVAANKTWVLSPGDFTPPMASTNCTSSANTSPCVGSFSATATGGQIVGAVVEAPHLTSPANFAQSTALFLPTDADTTVYCPVFKNAYGGGAATPRYTGITVQNTSGGAADVFLTLTAVGTGTKYMATANVPGGGSYTFSGQISNVGGFPSGAGGTTAGLGSATITSTVALIANVNEANTGSPVKATTYSCFAASGATTKIAFPQVKEEFAGSNTGVSVQNTGGSATNINAVYTCSGVNYTHVAVNLLPGASYTYFRPHTSAANWSGSALPNNKLCAVLVTSDGQGIVGVAQEAAYPSGAVNTANYEGFNLP